MQKITMDIAKHCDETETRTAYLIPGLFHGYRFAVTRDDKHNPYGSSQFKWSVSQIDSGLGIGTLHTTRREAIQAFHERIKAYEDKYGYAHCVATIEKGIAMRGPINNLEGGK